MSISVLILTLNEEANLPQCLDAVAWCDDIVVLDSCSTDQTVRIAEEHGARVFTRRFDNWSAHCQWAMTEIDYKHRWVFSIDADERMPVDLREELVQVVQRPDLDRFGAFRLRYRNMFWGRWIRHATLYPTWITRFLDPKRVRYEERLVNAHPMVDGKVGDLQSHFEHYSFNRGLAHWFEKHNSYSTMEAMETVKSLAVETPNWSGLWHRDPMARRRALKTLSYRLPGRPLLKFGYMYLLRRGFLDGFPGFTYCALQAIYEYMIDLKVKELRRREQGLSL